MEEVLLDREFDARCHHSLMGPACDLLSRTFSVFWASGKNSDLQFRDTPFEPYKIVLKHIHLASRDSNGVSCSLYHGRDGISYASDFRLIARVMEIRRSMHKGESSGSFSESDQLCL